MLERIWNYSIQYWPIWVVSLMILSAILIGRMFWRTVRLPYRVRPRLVTKAELRFYRSLQKAVQDDWQIFAMVRIADILAVEEGIKNRRSWFNKIVGKHVDFVLCDPGTLQPVIGIELDDATHQRNDRAKRDAFVDAAFDAAELPLLRIPVTRHYQSREIRELIDQSLA
jgi:hypothetical protein